MEQLHKKFTNSQVKTLITRYLKKEIERKYIQEALGIKKTRFFALVKQLKEGLETRNLSIRVRYLDMILKLKDIYPADRNKVELTGKDGEPIGQTIFIIQKSYQNCPLKSTGECPIKEKVKLADDVRSGKIIGE